MGTVSHKEQCPQCASMGRDNSHDNLHVYEDQSVHCFACGYHPVTNKYTDLRLYKHERINGNHALPLDYSPIIGKEGKDWLNKYDLTKQEIEFNRIGWSESKKQLIFPVYDTEGKLMMYQARNFSPDAKTKYYTRGLKDNILHILGNLTLPRIVLTEDLISAIKVSRVTPAMPLWGSSISKKNLERLSWIFEELVIWLDADKALQAMETREQGALVFERSFVVVTSKDPKELGTPEIQMKLRGLYGLR